MPLRSTTEENSNANAHPKPSPPAALNHLKWLRGDVSDDSLKARSRPKKLDKTLPKLSRFSEASEPKKQQRNEMLRNRRFGGGSYTSKAGTLVQGNSSDLVPSRLEKTPKNVPLSKRIRSSIAETQADVRPLLMGRDRCTYKKSVEASLISEEKIDRLSAGGEGSEKKRIQASHNKLNNELGGQSSYYQGYSQCLETKKKMSRAPRTSHVIAQSSSPIFSTPPGIPDKEVGNLSVSKDQLLGVTNRCKRPMPIDLPVDSFPNWGCRKLKTKLRTRRRFPVSPVLCQEEVQQSSEGCLSSDLKVHRLRSHDAEERSPNGGQNTSSSLQGQESNMLNKEDIGDGVHRHGRASSGPSFPKVPLTSAREKSENTSSTKPSIHLKPDSDKIRSISKSGLLPMNKSDGNSFTRLGPRPTDSPDVSDSGCSSPSRKRMERISALVSTVTTENLKLQIKGTEAFDESLTQNRSYRNILGDVVHQEGFPSHAVITGERERRETASQLPSRTTQSRAPFCQRVLSALILDEELENNDVRCMEQELMPGLQNQYEHLIGRPLCNGCASVSKGTLPENSHLQGYQGLPNPEIPVNSGETPVSLHTHAFKATLLDCEYEMMSLDDKLLLELQSIGIYIQEPMDFAKAGSVLSGGEKKEVFVDYVCGSASLQVLSSPANDAKTGLILIGGEKKEVLLDDVGASASLQALSSPVNNISSGRKGKRSDREWDTDYNSAAKIGRKAGERKTKPKAKAKAKTKTKGKHKTAQPGKASTNKLKESTNSKEQPASNSVIEESAALNSPNSNPPPELDDDLDFDDSGVELQDYDYIGLPIPNDDISELFFLFR